MFSERGYTGTTVRDIAGEVGIRGASMYAHVRGKEDLLWDLLVAAADEFERRVVPVLESKDSPADRLRKAILAHVQVIADNVESATIYFHEWRFLGPRRRRAIRDRRDKYEALFRETIRAGVRDGSFRKRDPKYSAILLLSSLNAIYTWYRPSGVLSPLELGEQYADLFINGLT